MGKLQGEFFHFEKKDLDLTINRRIVVDFNKE